MYKSCSRCGKIHDTSYKCEYNKVKPNNRGKYNNTEEYRLRNTHKWHKKAEEIKKDSSYLCSVCYDKGIYNYNSLEVHHIEKIKDEPDRLLDNYNLICLCTKHHKLADNNMIDKEYLFKLAEARELKHNPPMK